jgi:hypothetical protein
MSPTNDTNITMSGSGTAADPYVYNFHTDARLSAHSYGMHCMFLLIVMIALGSAAAGGFLLGFYFGKRRNKPN